MLAFAAKRNMARGKGAGAFAVYLDSPDGRYLGDVGRASQIAGRVLIRPHREGTVVGWWAQTNQGYRLPLVFPTRAAAAAALAEA